jgi:cobalamin biosynthesis protein CbiD
MPEEWRDIARKSIDAKKLHPDIGECVIEIHTTASMPDRWIRHLIPRLREREVRYGDIVGDRIVARAEHPKAVKTVVGAIDWAIDVANAAYRVDLQDAEARRARQEGEDARLAEQQAALDEIVENIAKPRENTPKPRKSTPKPRKTRS